MHRAVRSSPASVTSSALDLPGLDLSRVAVVGTTCAGKTTFARELASARGAPHVELDGLFWGANWSRRADFEVRVREAVAAERWVLDGSYGSVRAAIWPRATTLVWLDLPLRVLFGRAVRRTCVRCWSREELFAGNRERFATGFLHPGGIPWWVLRTYHRRRRDYESALRHPAHGHLALLRPRSAGEVVELLAALRRSGGDR